MFPGHCLFFPEASLRKPDGPEGRQEVQPEGPVADGKEETQVGERALLTKGRAEEGAHVEQGENRPAL